MPKEAINIIFLTIIVKIIRYIISNYLENGEIVVLNNNDEIIIGRTVLRFNE